MSRTRFRVHVHKDWLQRQIRQYGASSVLRDWRGTDEEAIASVDMDTRECFVIDPECDHQDDRGQCLGHDLPEVHA